MNRLALVARLLALALIFSIFHLLQTQSAPTVTAVCGSINSSATWDLAHSPYEVCNTTGATVAAGVTVTVDPGFIVQFQQGSGNGSNPKLFETGRLNPRQL